MNHRRTRVHHSGASNLDYRTKDGKLERPFGTATLDFLATAKPKDKSEVFKPRLLRTAEDPLGKTKTFYADKGKEFKQKMDMAAPRFGHLEELEKRKPVFNGDSNTVYETKRTAQFGAGPRFTDGYQSDNQRPKKSGQSTKLDENSAALQETQLVGLDKFRSETLEGKVSIEKVREIKRAIRRRYANRKNLQKIFNLWDEENKGTISIPNVVNMVNRLGMNMNFDEARVLVASTNRDGSNQIKMDEFLDLIYNPNDTLSVNLAQLPPLSSELVVQKSQLDEGDPNFFGRLNQDAEQARRVRHNNQLYFILKNRTNELATHFLKEDQFQSGYINLPKFEAGMRKLGINEEILSDRDIKEMYDKFNTGEQKFDYKEYLHNLKEFQFNPDNIYKAQYEGIAKETFDMEAAEQILFGKSDNKIHILDVQKQHQSQLEKIFARAQRVNRAIHRYFPNKKDFQDFIAKQMNLNQDDAESKTVHQKQLHGVISTLFANFDDKLSNKDFEGFLSSITYNAHGEARIADVAKTLYDEDDTSYMVRIQKREHGPPPGLTADAKAENGETIKRDYLSTFFVSTQFPNQDDPKLGDILRRVEQKVFLGKTRAFDAFKQFDTDHDGYVSTQDVKKKLSEMCILNPKEEDVFIQYLDPQGKGHVNFTEFSARVKQNMTWNNKDGVNTVIPAVFTSKEVHDQNVAMLPEIPKKKAEVKRSYSPDSNVITRATRYGATPTWKDTFVSFQPDARSPMFAAESDRFRRDPNASVRFQQEAKDKKAAVHAAKLANIRSHHEQFRQKIDDATAKQDMKEEGKLREKGLRQSTYEQRLHLMGASG